MIDPPMIEPMIEDGTMESEEVLEYFEEEPELVGEDEDAASPILEEVERVEEANDSMEEGLEVTTTTQLRGSNGNN
jgi:hypothetical protein